MSNNTDTRSESGNVFYLKRKEKVELEYPPFEQMTDYGKKHIVETLNYSYEMVEKMVISHEKSVNALPKELRVFVKSFSDWIPKIRFPERPHDV